MFRDVYAADAHCDFLYYMLHRGDDIASASKKAPISIANMREGGCALQLFAAWIDICDKHEPLQQCLSMIDSYHSMLEANDCLVPFSKSFRPGEGNIATVLTVEGGEAVGMHPENVRILSRLGVKAMTLTWNEQNELASPATAKRDRGLTRAGIDAIREMAKVDMALDVAHLGDVGIDSALDEAEYASGGKLRVFSSHTNSRAVWPHRRSMGDRHIARIASMGGVIGVNYYSPQLTRRGRAEISDIVDHIVHIAKVGGAKSVALGSDFCGMGSEAYPNGLESWADVPKLLEALSEAGFSENEVKDIAYNNLAGFLAKLY